MLLGIDHLVIAVADPDAAAADLEAALGLAATGGGRHEKAGTFNRLIFLGDTYLELIGVWDRARATANPIGAAALAVLDAGTPGLVTWAIATDDARRAVAVLRGAGSSIGDAQPGERVRPDGGVVRWHVAIAPPLAAERPPFLIEHELGGPEWSDEARQARAAFIHPFGGRARIVGLELAVGRPADVAMAFARTIGVAFRPAPGAGPGELEALVGDHSIRLVAAAPAPASGVMAASGAVAGSGHLAGTNPGLASGSGPASGMGPASETGSGSADPTARVGILATAGEHLLVELCGVRFARL
jgi:catechol 2,3-dioxygenase-like lactoylglutathione lyase family enzyme